MTYRQLGPPADPNDPKFRFTFEVYQQDDGSITVSAEMEPQIENDLDWDEFFAHFRDKLGIIHPSGRFWLVVEGSHILRYGMNGPYGRAGEIRRFMPTIDEYMHDLYLGMQSSLRRFPSENELRAIATSIADVISIDVAQDAADLYDELQVPEITIVGDALWVPASSPYVAKGAEVVEVEHASPKAVYEIHKGEAGVYQVSTGFFLDKEERVEWCLPGLSLELVKQLQFCVKEILFSRLEQVRLYTAIAPRINIRVEFPTLLFTGCDADVPNGSDQ
jgi:hypothetical protein